MTNQNQKRGAETQHGGLSYNENVMDQIQSSFDTAEKMSAAAWRSSLVEARLRF
ncbi:unnamed protein product [Brassica oleracea var. botrytis]|uniref:(rape) hypothetical protein n=1 Tax=Brassica napus TaxID=3708 RepID=A0A078JI36_BRANA|nr:unnamed protein product [Brassica napus]CDY65401.1 BnaUnng01090D [Brassica napus]